MTAESERLTRIADRNRRIDNVPPTEGRYHMATKKKATKARAVLVTTAHRGVFFGYATNTDGDTISLKDARNCIYWSVDVRGFLGLASAGPTKGCRIGPKADLTVRNITAVAEVSPEAVKAWEAGPWA